MGVPGERILGAVPKGWGAGPAGWGQVGCRTGRQAGRVGGCPTRWGSIAAMRGSKVVARSDLGAVALSGPSRRRVR